MTTVRTLRCPLAAVLGLVAIAAVAQPADSACGSLANAYGPFDYRTDRDKLPIVEHSHFTPSVEALIRGVSSYIGGDLDYLLRAFPNHHRGLQAMTRLFERGQWAQPAGANYSIDCYYDRALRFRPDDVLSRLLFVAYLNKRGRQKEALAQLSRGESDASDNGFTHYNIGLLYLEMKQFDKATAQAHRAMSLGFTRPDLMERLQAAGHWTEPPAATGSDAAASTSAAQLAPSDRPASAP